MGLFDAITGTRKPAVGVAPKPASEVRAAILAVGRPTAPFVVRPARPEEKADLVAEWRVVDAKWYEVFAKAGLTKSFKVLMRVDDAAQQVRAVDQEWQVEWRAGVPHLSLAASAFRGQKTSVEVGAAYAFTEEVKPGRVYRYRFATKEIKEPLQDAVTGAGWTWKAVSFGKL